MAENESPLFAVRVVAENQKGVLKDIATVVTTHSANIVMIHQETFDSGPLAGLAELYFEYEEGPEVHENLIKDLNSIHCVRSAESCQPFSRIYGKRVIIIGGGAQVAQVALGAVNEADRHNIRGERISVDTIPLVGEETVALAVDAVARLPRAGILVLAGSLMGGKISDAVERVREAGIPVIALKMVGSVTRHVDLVVTDPIQAGVLAVMHVSTIGVFDIARVRGKEF